MSDSALSQDEIDALLNGSGSASKGGAATGGASAAEIKPIQDLFAGMAATHSSNLSGMIGAEITLSGPQIECATREALLARLPDTVTFVKSDFTAGFPGAHAFIFSEDTAKAIASLMNKEENIELDDMALSVIGELVSQIVGAQITALTSKTGNKSIASMPPETSNVPKAVAALPNNGQNYLQAVYDLTLNDGQSHQIWEVFGPPVSSAVVNALSGGGSGKSAGSGNAGPGQGVGGGFVSTPPNMQSVQFPNFSTQMTAQEAGNIGLLMDVFMEMTVELGRTKKLIKDILSMGEGTMIELDKLAGEPVDVLVNNKLIAKGEVVVIDEKFGIRITEIVAPAERLTSTP